MQTLTILRGLPGSGKTTLASKMLAGATIPTVRINRDDLRAMIVGKDNDLYGGTGDEVNAREKLVRNMRDALIKCALESGNDVIIDDTNLINYTMNHIHGIAKGVGNVTVSERYVDVPIDECIRRDSLRTGSARVGEQIIRSMARSAKIDGTHVPRDVTISYENRDSIRQKAIIVDLDGTLSIMGNRSPYDASRCDELDVPYEPMLQLLLASYEMGCRVVFITGRPEKYRDATVRFIEKYCVIDSKVIEFELYMRSDNDQRKDDDVKSDLYDKFVMTKYDVIMCYDDRTHIIDMWQKKGLSTYCVAQHKDV